MTVKRVLLAVLVLSGCTPPPASAPPPRYGALMHEVGERFEILGRAAAAKRWELAAFELHELEEVFEELATANLPKEVPAADGPRLRGIEESFVKTHVPELSTALKAKDATAVTTAFERAAGTCNACHVSSGFAFVEIPTAPGASIPKLDPL